LAFAIFLVWRYGLALAALAPMVFGAIECPPEANSLPVYTQRNIVNIPLAKVIVCEKNPLNPAGSD